MGDFNGAETHYRKLIIIAPKSQTTWASLSYLAEMRGNLDEAAMLMEKALNAGYKKNVNAATLAWLHTILGELEAKRGKLDVARMHYATALKHAPDHRLALEFNADLDAWQGNSKAAEHSYRKLIAQQFDPKIQLRLADLVEQRGDKAEAARLREESLHFFERVIAGGNEGYLRELARLDLAAGRYQRAAELAARDVELRPTMESRMLYASIPKRAEAVDASR
jgi:tetratricopeptide (TPR) repeat protein